MIEIIIVIAFLVYIGFREWLTHEHIRDLELKAFSKNPQEYAALKNIEKSIKKSQLKEKEEDEMIDPFEVDPNDAIKGIIK